MSDPVARRRVGAVVRGIVQGVGFRRFVERTGSGLGLDGWVMNRADGSVELDAEGPPDAIDALIAAHGNSLRALVMHLDAMSESAIVELNIPTAIPLVYELDDQLKPIRHYYLGDPKAAAAAAARAGSIVI